MWTSNPVGKGGYVLTFNGDKAMILNNGEYNLDESTASMWATSTALEETAMSTARTPRRTICGRGVFHITHRWPDHLMVSGRGQQRVP